jgi:hypothetical protein
LTFSVALIKSPCISGVAVWVTVLASSIDEEVATAPPVAPATGAVIIISANQTAHAREDAIDIADVSMN